MQEAVDAAKEAFKSWSQTTVMARQQYMLRYQQLIKDNMVTILDYLTGSLSLRQEISW